MWRHCGLRDGRIVRTLFRRLGSMKLMFIAEFGSIPAPVDGISPYPGMEHWCYRGEE